MPERDATFLACCTRIYALVRAIPRGRVMTYSQLAALACPGSPVPAITVGRALAASGRYDPDLPWWRVIGESVGRGILRSARNAAAQRALLAAEDVRPDDDGAYDLAHYRFQAQPAE